MRDGQPRCHGPGACLGNARHAPSALIAQMRRLCPNPIGSSTLRHRLAVMHGWMCHTPTAPDKQAHSRACQRRTTRTRSARAASDIPPRRKTPSAAPKVLSVDRYASIEACSVPRQAVSSPELGTSDAFSIFVCAFAFDGGKVIENSVESGAPARSRTNHKTAAPLTTSAF